MTPEEAQKRGTEDLQRIANMAEKTMADSLRLYFFEGTFALCMLSGESQVGDNTKVFMITPQMVKRFAAVFADQVKNYETIFGEIKFLPGSTIVSPIQKDSLGGSDEGKK